MIDEAFLERLTNWRRVYGDRHVYRRSSTFDICQYLRAYADRKPETEEEKYWREAEELRYREPAQPSPNYKDADFLQTVWAHMPEMIEYVPVKKNIRIFVFGTEYDYIALKRRARIRRDQEKSWREFCIESFQKRVYYEQDIRKQLQLEND